MDLTKKKKDDAAYQEVKEAIDLHIATLVEGKAQARTLLDYLTYTVQNPGAKITWALLIQGTQGNGKSFLYSLMEKALGVGNASTTDAAELQGEFNGFAHGSQLVFIEDMQFQGRGKHAAWGRIKSLVSSESLVIRVRYRERYTAPNLTNYVLLTNDTAKIPLSEEDRRFYVVRTKQQSRADVLRDMPIGYFDTLFSVLEHPRDIRRYFQERKVSDAFEPKGAAPIK